MYMCLNQCCIEEAPPTDFSVSLYHDDGIHVSWTPAPTASSSSDYIIYYETSSAVELVLVSGTENSYIIRGLTFGSTYSVSVAARSDFQSPSIGPKKIEIGMTPYNSHTTSHPSLHTITCPWV